MTTQNTDWERDFNKKFGTRFTNYDGVKISYRHLDPFQKTEDVITYFKSLLAKREQELEKRHKKELEDVIDKLWKDDELQDAICNYGEWNGTELDKVFEKVKKKLIEPRERGKAMNFEVLKKIIELLESVPTYPEKKQILGMAEAFIAPTYFKITKTGSAKGITHPIQEALLKVANETTDFRYLSYRKIGELLGLPVAPQQIKHHLTRLRNEGLYNFWDRSGDSNLVLGQEPK